MGAPTEPLITVAMPVYNAGSYLRPALLSILAQTCADWELLIIDDRSTDSALDSIADIHDPRIRILRDGSNKGLAARLNQAIDLAKGRYLARMDQDDISYPERFARQLELLRGEPALDLVAVRAIRISERNEVLGLFPSPLTHAEICARPWQGFHFPHPTWMGRIEWFRKHRYKIPQQYFCEDQELLLRSYRDSRFACVPEILFAYRSRDRVDLKKQLRTRVAILKVQLLDSWQRHALHFMLLSLAVFALRIGADLFGWMAQRVAGNGARAPKGKVSQHDLQAWERVRTSCFGSGDGR